MLSILKTLRSIPNTTEREREKKRETERARDRKKHTERGTKDAQNN
jgi:hypothetical protein